MWSALLQNGVSRAGLRSPAQSSTATPWHNYLQTDQLRTAVRAVHEMSGAGCVRAPRGPGAPVPPPPPARSRAAVVGGSGAAPALGVGHPRVRERRRPCWDVGPREGPAPWGAWGAGGWPCWGIAGARGCRPWVGGDGGRGVLGCGPGRDGQAHQCPHGPNRLWVLGKKFWTIHRRGRKPYPWGVLPHLELGSIRKIKINMIFLWSSSSPAVPECFVVGARQIPDDTKSLLEPVIQLRPLFCTKCTCLTPAS